MNFVDPRGLFDYQILARTLYTEAILYTNSL